MSSFFACDAFPKSVFGTSEINQCFDDNVCVPYIEVKQH